MRRILLTIAILMGMAMPIAASAQFSESYNFLKAVRERDGTETMKFLNKQGGTIIDTHDSSNGDTALHIVTRDRDTTWLGFMLAKGAKVDTRNSKGETPLLIAAQLGYDEGVELLLNHGASIDLANGNGETALILATQNDNVPLVRLLLENGANPDKTDHISGTSARTYAQRFTRDPTLAQAFSETRAVHHHAAAQGPKL